MEQLKRAAEQALVAKKQDADSKGALGAALCMLCCALSLI